MSKPPTNDDEYEPENPSYNRPPHDDGKTTTRTHPRSPPPPPNSPGYNPTSPNQTIKTENEVQTWFDLHGNPFKPINIGEIAKPVVTKALRCSECRGFIDIEEDVPAFLLRRKDEPDVPDTTPNQPWWWTQAFCVQCRYTFRVKIHLPKKHYKFCTLDRYPPSKPKDGVKKYSNGLPALDFAMDDGPSDMVRQRRANYPPRQRSPPRNRSPYRARQNRSRSPRQRSPLRRRSPPPARQRSPPRPYRDRSRSPRRDTSDAFRQGYYDGYHDLPRRVYNESNNNRYPPQQYVSQSQFYDAASQYGQTTAPAQSYQQYTPELHTPIPAPNVNAYSR